MNQQHEELFEPGPRGKRGAERGWDILMMNARKQAEDYAKALPSDHDWPPFILVCDVGHVIEVYSDFTGKGRNYTQFPDRQGFRIFLEDLRSPVIRERLKLIWTKPHELEHFGLAKREEVKKHIRRFRNGRDITAKSRNAYVIDFYGLSEREVRENYPEIYQHLLIAVRDARKSQFETSSTKDAKAYLEKWWEFGKPRPELREMTAGMKRWIVSVHTAKHRVFFIHFL